MIFKILINFTIQIYTHNCKGVTSAIQINSTTHCYGSRYTDILFYVSTEL